jgi:5-formyltetrahydrofolate cyclo-ligase
MVSWQPGRSWQEEDEVVRLGDPYLALSDRPIAEQKQVLRRRIVNERAQRVSNQEQTGQDAARTAALLAYPPIRAATTVAAYVTRSAEPDADQLRAALRARGLTVLLPRLLEDDDLAFVRDTGGRLEPGPRGTSSPAGPPVALDTADVIVVPALAVDGDGHRLGRGGGSYDRALARARPGIALIALLHPGELLHRVPTDPHDIPVTAVALPGGVVRLRR